MNYKEKLKNLIQVLHELKEELTHLEIKYDKQKKEINNTKKEK